MPTWFDTHAHLDDFAADGTLDAVLSRAAAAGVTRICAMEDMPERTISTPGRDAAKRMAQLGMDMDGSWERKRRAASSGIRASVPPFTGSMTMMGLLCLRATS